MTKGLIKKKFTIASASPCGHCGSRYNQLSCHGGARPDGAPVNLAYHVSCRKCRACGPIASSAAEAVKGWEHRAPPRQNEDPPAFLPDIDFEGEEESSEPEDGKSLPN
jgi:hypothetical protein